MMRRIVILSGAGLSADSGIQTFRDEDGLWENHRVEDVATMEGFRADPQLVHQFYNARRRQLSTVEPNAAHHALSKLEQMPGIELLHVTQNIDDLCERAGSTKVVHMHGELTKCRCLKCQDIFDWEADTSASTACPSCGFISKWGGIRPHVVWFGEIPLLMETIEQAIGACELFAAIGTSGQVYPAAGFVQLARFAGAETVLLNKEAPTNIHEFDHIITGTAGVIVPEWVDGLCSELEA